MSKKRHRREQRSVQPAPKPAVKLPELKAAVIVVAVLVIVAFMSRIDSFKKEHPLSFDETVYSVLAAQMIKTPGVYNTVAIYQDSVKKGRKLPEYFNKPLFKHPPFFAWLISASYRLFGMSYFSAFKVSLFFGVLLIPLAYLFGKTLFDEKTGIYAALIMVIEPVSWIASQKIWMETTLAFFTVLSLCLFAMCIKKYNPYLAIASGIASGLAALCKYPGILAVAIIFTYAAVADRSFFRKKSFILGLCVPFFMLTPWLIKNFGVYGVRLDLANVEIAQISVLLVSLLQKSWWFIAIIAAFVLVLALMRRRMREFYEKVFLARKEVFCWLVSGVVFLALFAIIAPSLIKALSPAHVPESGWKIGMFIYAPWHFYLGRLVELSPFYFFSSLGILLFAIDRERRKEYIFLFISSFLILGLYILWRNYQCRYIMAAVVPLTVLSARTLQYIFETSNKIGPVVLQRAVRVLLVVAVLCAAAKTLNIDMALAVPNNVCYF